MHLLQEDHISRKHPLASVLSNTQGYILIGHGCDYLSYGFLRFKAREASELRKAFAALSKLITPAARLAEDKAIPRDKRPADLVVWAVGISSAGYNSMRFENRFPPSFWSGFASRARSVTLQGHDQWTDIWKDGARWDAIIALGARKSRNLTAARKTAAGIFGKLAGITWRDAFIKRVNRQPVEHFGFADGVDQPVFFDTHMSRASAGGYTCDPKAPLSLVLVRDPFRSAPEAPEYGSYCAVMSVEQHPRRFTAAAKTLGKQVGCPAHAAEELIIGRKKNGDPLTPSGAHSSDPDNERVWPMASHTRRMNLRQHPHRRILRRGALYQHGSEKGLLFQSFQASLEEQFEFILKAWVNNPNHPAPGTGIDPVMGTLANGGQNWPLQNGGSGKVNCPVNGLTTIRGGEYFYFPSISALAAMPLQP